ncbi:MAG: hypothetical protein HBSAPP03_18490 [Phycisphaerae bacterium]|nr:MAG: hypothetical protein HBSAPP03_18490 [Phycisphaerae bacterium]
MMSDAPSTMPALAPAQPQAGPDYTRRAWVALLACILLAGLLLPIDGFIMAHVAVFQKGGRLQLGGDLRRTLEFLQQFGDLASSLLVATCIFLLDPAIRRRMLDWLAAAAATSLAVWLLKMAIGRARPRLAPPAGDDVLWQSLAFTGPFGTYPLTHTRPGGIPEVVQRHSWEFWNGVSDLWSMPSSHTSAAAVLAVALATMYPKLRPLAWSLLGLVALTRVLFGAHFPSDVVLGAGIGVLVASLAMHHRLGQRLVTRVGWIKEFPS